LQKSAISLAAFLSDLKEHPALARVPGTAVFMTTRHLSMPHGLQMNFEHNHVLHERVILLTISTEDIPYIPDEEKIAKDILEQGFFRITAKHGFMEIPDVPHILRLCKEDGLDIDAHKSSFFISRETLVPSSKPDLPPWQERVFLVMFRNATSPIQFFNIPPERVLELGAQIEV
jgi:KUP system potassium uptake protein